MPETQPGPLPPDQPHSSESGGEEAAFHFYKIRFRAQSQECTASAHADDLIRGDQVMVRTEQGPEPATIVTRCPTLVGETIERPVLFRIQRQASNEEREKYAALPILEQEAFRICRRQIESLRLPMHLVRVERFFNGSKIIFYFTAESRVDFRELVKALGKTAPKPA